MPNKTVQNIKKSRSCVAGKTRQRHTNPLLRNQSVTIPATATRAAAPGTIRATRTASATTRATGTATRATATAATAGLLRTGFVYGQRTAVNALAIECGYGGLSLLIRTHLDKGEALRALRFTVSDHLCRNHRAMRGKHLLKIVLVRVVAQVAYV
jgi:hypothetical protein